ncbi:MAG: hypothetical protein KF764_26030 [Labilithrix sp.]|nr:hypothetical protein [Labilithrix sp.]
MSESRVRSSRVGSGLVASVVASAIMLACGGGGAKAPASGSASADAGLEAGAAAQLAATPPPTGLPPMASMPPPGVVGSKKAKRRSDAALAACGAMSRPQAKDPSELVKKLGEACAASSKMKPLGALLRGQQADKDAHQASTFRAEANRCYRVYFAGDEAVKDMVVVLRDSTGDIVAEAPAPAVPEEGAACFTVADEVSVLVAVGGGKGAWAAQVWSD